MSKPDNNEQGILVTDGLPLAKSLTRADIVSIIADGILEAERRRNQEHMRAKAEIKLP